MHGIENGVIIEFKKRITPFIISLISFFISINLSAQEGLNYQQFSSKNGLPSNEVYHMYQDVNGILWFATDRGICRYNGYEFESLGLEDGLTGTTVFRFFPQKNGDVWCSTINNRLFIFNPVDYQFREYKNNDQLVAHSHGGIIDDLYLEDNGTLHIAYAVSFGVTSIGKSGELQGECTNESRNGVINVVLEEMNDGRTFSYLESEPVKRRSDFKGITKQTIPKKDYVYHKTAQRNEIKLLSSNDRVWLYRGKELVKVISIDKKPIGLGFYEDNQFWVGFAYGGIKFYDLSGNENQSFLMEESVSRVLVDHNKGLWISTTTSGVYYAANAQLKYHEIGPLDVNNLAVNGESQLVVNMENGESYVQVDNIFTLNSRNSGKTSAQNQYYSSIGLHFDFFHSSIKMNTPISREECYIANYSDEKDEAPWFNGRTRIYTIDNLNNLLDFALSGRVTDVCPMDGNIYVAMQNGLYLYDTITRRQKKIKHKLLNICLPDIDLFNGNKLIIASRGNGLILKDGNRIFSITKKNGLTGNLVSEVYVQNDSILWACTNTGLNRIKFYSDGSYSIKNLTQQDGLIDNDVTDVEVIDQTVWVSTRSGLNSFSLNMLDEVKPSSHYFLNLLNSKVNHVSNQILDQLEYWQNEIEFNFEAISFSAKNNLEYRYRLVGLNSDWNYTKSLIVKYEALPPGEYLFELQAGTKGNFSNELVVRKIRISPPYYQTTWFRLMITGLISLLIYLFFKYRILSYNKDISREILRQLLKRLKNKTNHFTVRSNGKDIRIQSQDVLFVKSADNYIEIHTTNTIILVREKISNFSNIIPDEIEYLRIHRSCIVRLDKITSKSIDSITINHQEFKVGRTYLKVLSQIHL